SASYDRTVKLWDIETRTEVHTFRGHSNWVMSVAIEPDGTRILSGGLDNTIRLWDTKTGEEIRAVQTEIRGGIYGVAFSADGARVAAAGGAFDGMLKVWNAKTGKEELLIKVPEVRLQTVAFAPDGRRLAAGGANGLLKVWDSSTGKEILDLKGHR